MLLAESAARAKGQRHASVGWVWTEGGGWRKEKTVIMEGVILGTLDYV